MANVFYKNLTRPHVHGQYAETSVYLCVLIVQSPMLRTQIEQCLPLDYLNVGFLFPHSFRFDTLSHIETQVELKYIQRNNGNLRRTEPLHLLSYYCTNKFVHKYHLVHHLIPKFGHILILKN